MKTGKDWLGWDCPFVVPRENMLEFEISDKMVFIVRNWNRT